MTANEKKSPARRPSSAAGASDTPGGKRKRFVFFLTLLLFAAVAGLVVFAMLMARKLLFTGNDRLCLRNVQLHATGFWKNRGNLLSLRLNLRPGKNLYEIDVPKLRDRIESIPSIESASVRRILPDTIAIDLVERVPRACIGSPRSNLVVDERCVAFPRREAMQVANSMPVILGLNGATVELGTELKALQPAMRLLMTIVRNYPDFSLNYLDIRDQSRIVFVMHYRNLKTCRVIFPADCKNLNFLLSCLQSAVITALRRGDTRHVFDLTFSGSVIIK